MRGGGRLVGPCRSAAGKTGLTRAGRARNAGGLRKRKGATRPRRGRHRRRGNEAEGMFSAAGRARNAGGLRKGKGATRPRRRETDGQAAEGRFARSGRGRVRCAKGRLRSGKPRGGDRAARLAGDRFRPERDAGRKARSRRRNRPTRGRRGNSPDDVAGSPRRAFLRRGGAGLCPARRRGLRCGRDAEKGDAAGQAGGKGR